MENKRDYIYDFLRVVSCIFIICIHCSERFLHGYGYDYFWWQYNITSSIVRSGLLLFIFISGALLLNKKDENFMDFYKKRFLKVVIPFFVYSLLYVFIDEYNCNFSFFLPYNFLTSIAKIFSTPACYHLWFVYIIIGIYVFTPFLRKLLQSLTDKDCIYLFILLYLVSFVMYFLPSLGVNINLQNVLFASWNIPFVLGYLLTRSSITKYYKCFYVLGILSFVFLVFAERFLPNFAYLYDLSPTMLLQSQALFLFFINNKNDICSNVKLNKIVANLALYIYEIYLVHPKVLDFLQIFVFDNVSPSIGYLTMVVSVILVFIISFVLAFIINRVIIKNVTNFFYWFINKVHISKLKI